MPNITCQCPSEIPLLQHYVFFDRFSVTSFVINLTPVPKWVRTFFIPKWESIAASTPFV